ncbi:breast carcinoma-amplified sequence 1 isoform X2 [Heptranchias perlo]|uniref:breast carcinoma-amplified sequence 1 isoform X2 n=1 Tax=Heptranchias perlo TaxID=212740 RepID=UPI00355A4DCB
MGNAVPHEPLNDTVGENSSLEQTKAETDIEIVQNGPTRGKPVQNSVQNKSDTDMWRFDYLLRRLHLKSGDFTVDTVADVKQDSGTFIPQKTIEMNCNTNAEEKELEKSAKAASKSRFSMSFSRSVPGRTNGLSTEPISGTAKLQTNQESASVNTASVDKVNLQESSSQKGSSAQKHQQLSTESSDAAEPPEKETEQPKQKEVSFFDKLFKQGEKGKLQNENQGDLKSAESQDPAAADKEATELIHRLDSVQQYLETGEGNKDHITPSNVDNVSQNPTPAKSSENLKESEKDNKAETPADDKSVMNFFKTLVTPTKPSSKTEHDPQQASDEKKVNGEHKEAATKGHKLEQKAAPQQEVSKTKDAESPEKTKPEKAPTQSPFGKLFKQKTIKEVPQVEQENVTSTTDAKSVKITSQPQTEISKQEGKSPESAQKAKSEEEVKPAKKSFLNFFKQMSVKEDEKHADSVDSPAKNSDWKESGLTEDPAKKGPEAREISVQPAKKGKDNSKQKKSAPEVNQEEPQRTKSLEALPPTQQPNTNTVPIPNGNNIKTKETPEKRLEKKQSFGVFLKQLGGKKTADVAVQTDPVVIYPAGKAK